MDKDSLSQIEKRFFSQGASILHNVNRVNEADDNKRALLIYLTKPFLIEDDDPLYLVHQNLRRCRIIARVLGELGYLVDVAERNDRTITFSGDYDLIISDLVDLQGRDAQFKERAIKLFLATTDNHITHNNSLRRRHDSLYQRRNCDLPLRREYSTEMPFVIKSNAIIGVGNEVTMGSWRSIFPGPIYCFNNCGVKETILPRQTKDFESVRKNFLFFASWTQVQKGLDLLLEIFPKHPELHLYVCSPFEYDKEFCECYRQELYETPNIHPIGWTTVGSPEFHHLIDNISCVIHPTCSEGQAGSVVQCMYSGLIPLVTKEAGINTDDFGITFANDNLAEIERIIVEVSELPADWHREQSIKTSKVAQEKYSETVLVKRWESILSEITGAL